jgi:hypothetical protein
MRRGPGGLGGVRVFARMANLPNMIEKSQARESVIPHCPTSRYSTTALVACCSLKPAQAHSRVARRACVRPGTPVRASVACPAPPQCRRRGPGPAAGERPYEPCEGPGRPAPGPAPVVLGGAAPPCCQSAPFGASARARHDVYATMHNPDRAPELRPTKHGTRRSSETLGLTPSRFTGSAPLYEASEPCVRTVVPMTSVTSVPKIGGGT